MRAHLNFSGLLQPAPCSSPSLINLMEVEGWGLAEHAVGRARIVKAPELAAGQRAAWSSCQILATCLPTLESAWLYQSVLSHSVMSNSLQPCGLQPTRLLCTWGFFSRQVLDRVILYNTPPPGDLPNPGIEPKSPTLQVDISSSELPGKPCIRVIVFNPALQKLVSDFGFTDSSPLVSTISSRWSSPVFPDATWIFFPGPCLPNRRMWTHRDRDKLKDQQKHLVYTRTEREKSVTGKLPGMFLLSHNR